MIAGCGGLPGRPSVDRLSWETPWRACHFIRGVCVWGGVHTCVCVCGGRCRLVCLWVCKCMLKPGVTMCKHARSSPQPLPSTPSLASLASCPGDSLGQWGTWGETGGRLEGQGEENREKMRRARGLGAEGRRGWGRARVPV